MSYPRITAAVRLALSSLGLFSGEVVHAVTLPVPCGAGTCVAGANAGTQGVPGFQRSPTQFPPAGFVTSGQATAVSSGNTLTVTQTSDQAILNWASFNVSADGRVAFKQPGSTSIALNKIYQASPSSIFGQVTANGQLYLINPNGFVFGSTATVNVAGLIASSLGLYNGDAGFSAGILSAVGQQTPQPELASDNRVSVLDANGNVVLDSSGKPQSVEVVVQPGAQMNASDKGRLLLAGQVVKNGGSLSAPDGQIVLAAGQAVYLQASTDPSLRGLIVEVNNNATPGTGTAPTSPQGTAPADVVGTVSNQAGAVLSAPRGNVSLMGLAVNQSGRISATTSVNANGSVILQAANGQGQGSDPNAPHCAGLEPICATQGGTLNIGSSSEIDVLPEVSDTTTTVAAASSAQLQSKLTLTGQQVDIEGGQINAPGGQLAVLAAANPDAGLVTEGNGQAQIRVATGTSINLAGSDANLPMSANLLSIQLRANELADDPVQRDNAALHGQTVIVDTRSGRPPIISDPAWVAALGGIQEDIAQRTATGGSASFLSEGDVVFNSGASINVSGGQWNYAGGVIQTSRLLAANGQTFSIGTANPLIAYTGVLNPTFTQTYNGLGVQIVQPTPGFSQYQSGYTQGFSAGTVTFAAPSMALQGTLQGSAVNGLYQRSVATIASESFSDELARFTNSATLTRGMAYGGKLVLGLTTAPSGAGALPDFFAPGVTITADPAPIIVADGTPLPQQSLELPASYLTSSGFAQTQIFSDSTVTLPAGLPLNLGVGSSLQVVAPRIAIGSNITALGGSIDLENAQTAFYSSSNLPRLGIDIGDGVALDVRGQWTNDSPLQFGTPGLLNSQGTTALQVAPSYQDGGQITLSLLSSSLSPTTAGGELVLGNDVSLLAGGGAWVKSNNSVVGGKGGSITLNASPYQSAVQVGSDVTLDAFGTNGALGGSFSLSAPRVAVGQGNGSWAASQRADDLSNPGQVLQLGAALYADYGFSSVSLTGTAPVQPTEPNTDVMTVVAGTQIDARTQSLQLNTGYLSVPTGGTVDRFSTPTLLPEYRRNPQALSFASFPGDLFATAIGDVDVQQGVTINTDPGSSLTFNSQGSILIGGRLSAPGGTITATIAGQPSTLTDPGYLQNQRIELGSESMLDVSGTAVLRPNTLNLPIVTGTVLPGGSVTLEANRGEVIADAGSSIDVSGSSALLNVQGIGGIGGYTAATMGSSGGKLTVLASQSISLLGSLSATAGASSVGSLEGGQLEVDLTSQFNIGSGTHSVDYVPFPNQPATIDLVSSTAGSVPTASYGNLAVLGITELEKSGIDFLTLRADNTISINSDTPVSFGAEISLDAPNVAVGYANSVTLNAPYVAFKDSLLGIVQPRTAFGGNGTLTVNAQQIVLSGYTGLQGVGTATFSSSGDVEFEPALGTSSLESGGLTVAGDLALNASRIYPATNMSFEILDSSATGTVRIGQTAKSPGTPLSANGSLQIDAWNIESSGTLLAPFGSITLTAGNSLKLDAGSVTSVSAGGTVVPYGQTEVGQQEWVYNGNTQIYGIPTRQISLTGPKVTFAQNATIDVSGGGDLSAYEFVPGTGGSVDALGQTNAAQSGLYAILPSTLNQYAAYDLQEFPGSKVNPGSSVYLSGISGLAPGVYPLLPARYALLPGAILIQAESGFQSLKPGVIGNLTDGTPVVAGYLTFGNSGLQISSGYTGFAVYPGSYSQSLAQYSVSSASGFFASQAAAAGVSQVVLPTDAGAVIIAAGQSLDAEGTVLSAGGKGGTAATISISATDLHVTSDPLHPASDGVSIGATVLQSWNAGDLVLGGLLNPDGTVTVTADKVSIDSGADFSAGQVLAVANTGIEVHPGATVASLSGVSGTPLTAPPTATALTLNNPRAADGTVTADPGAALLAVSDSSLPIVSRPSGGTAGVGSITLDSNATLATRGALVLDGPTAVNVNDQAIINAPGASWSLASNSIAFVPSAASGGTTSGNTQPDSLLITPALVSQMQSAGAVRLASSSSIDLLTAVNLGAASSSSAPTLGSVTLVASQINNGSAAANINPSNVVFGGRTLTLQGTGSGAPTTATGGTGNLSLVAGTLNISGTNLTVNGNSQTTLQVSGAVVGQAVSANDQSQDTGVLGIAGNLTINAAELTAASHPPSALAASSGGANGTSSNTGPDTSLTTATSIAATGQLQINQNGTAVQASSLTNSLGGYLQLTAAQITDSGSIIVPGGRVSMQAAGDLELSGAAVVNTAGITVSAVDQLEGAAGGIVNIAAGGNLTLGANTSINVAGALNAPGGYLNLSGGKNVTLDGTLSGGAVAGVAGGNLNITAGGSLVNGLSPALYNTLSTGGFNNQINIRTGTGDLDLSAGQTLTANHLTLTADTGVVNVAGTLDAPAGDLSGFIGLYGSNGVTVSGTLSAEGVASVGHGGEIELSSVNSANPTCTSCAVTLNGSAILRTSGGQDSGELVIEAPIYNVNDVAINVGSSGLGANVSGVGKIIVAPVMVDNQVNAANVTTNLPNDLSNASAYLTAATPTITTRLGTGGAFSVQTGVELLDTSNEILSLPSQDLTQFSTAGQVLDLTVRSAGGLVIGGNITDGYSSGLYAKGVDSGTLRFVAGADTNSANPLATAITPAVIFPANGNAPVSPPTLSVQGLVSTGTGNIDLVSSGSINFAAGAAAYTTGVTGAPAGAVKKGAGKTIPEDFSVGGGNVTLAAGTDVVASPVQESVTDWDIRNGVRINGTSNPPVGQWGPDVDEFAKNPWSVATLGGGDVHISAGHDVINVSAAAADSEPAGQPLFASGGMSVSAGRDITSSQFFVADGSGTLNAGRSFATNLMSTGTTSNPVGSSIALQNAAVSLWAEGDIIVSALYNPSTFAQPLLNGGSAYFVTYGGQSAFNAQTASGNIILNNDPNSWPTLFGAVGNGLTTSLAGLNLQPGTLRLVSLSGDIASPAPIILSPAPNGQLQLFAGRNIVGGNITMSDASADKVPTPATMETLPVLIGDLTNQASPLYDFFGDIHANDPTPVSIVAGQDIGTLAGFLNLSVPKAARIEAGRDILSLIFRGQNLSPNDLTLISAGRDFVDPTTFLPNGDPNGAGQVQVGGPGRLDVLAGRNIDLGFSQGVVTVGNLVNANLGTPVGADITMVAGLGQNPDFSDFFQKIIEPSSTYQQQLVSYVESLNGQSNLTVTQAETDFAGSTADQQRPLIDSVFFSELNLSGIEANTTAKVGYSRGYTAIDALFPGSRSGTPGTASDPYDGSLNLTYSQIYTLSGGGISLLVPGGQIGVGLANAPPGVAVKPPSQLGIVAQGAGDVNIYSLNDVNVNASRIFTLGGGNIVIWSDLGNIDAGNGAKSSLSLPPPTTEIDPKGDVTLVFDAGVAGSGIRTIQTSSTEAAGSVNLIAPVGAINAGDAGIGAAGNINLSALVVTGASNINFGGTATGVPPAVSGLTASLSGAASAASSATTSATAGLEKTGSAEAAPITEAAVSWLDVFVTGLGEENCKTDDLECLKRQRHE